MSHPIFQLNSQAWQNINFLTLSVESFSPKKRYVFEQAIKAFVQIPTSQQQMLIYTIEPFTAFKLDKKTKPSYFTQTFKLNKQTAVFSTTSWYEYTLNKDEASDVYYVDFANRWLGGGFAGDNGFVQEEIMFTVLPQLADYASHAAKRIGPTFYSSKPTRIGGDGVLKGTPTPLIFKGVKKVADFAATPIYGKTFQALKLDEFMQYVDENYHSLPQAKELNIVAIAAPNLGKEIRLKEKLGRNVVADFYNTCFAAFSAMQLASPGKEVRIATGRLGAGVFNNDPILSNVVQQVVARHVGISELIFHGYDVTLQQQADSVVTQVLRYARNKGASVENVIGIISRTLQE